ncbi:MAG: methyltransferase domain-containing protein [Omnitrophica WOR_2 bacterium]
MPVSIGLMNRLPPRARKYLVRALHPAWFGTLRRTTPLSSRWGKDRGTPVDRYYIDHFLMQYPGEIHGCVLEVGAPVYTSRFGQGLERCEILDNNPANPQATLLADLERPLDIPSSQFDCLVFTQVFQFIYPVQASLEELYRILKPGGVLFATLPGVSRVDLSYGPEKDYWRFSASACEKMFGAVFGSDRVAVRSYGNVLSAIAFLAGVSCEELSHKELDAHDPLFQVLIGVRAVKP